MKSLLSLGLCLAALLPLRAAEPFRFQENDLVVFLGDTWVEREQRDGAIETALLMSGGVAELRFRNLGWSGDTVRCDARGYFGGPAEGFDRLTASLSELHPTVVFLSYGGAESFGGAAGLPEFRQGYERLLDRVTSTASPREIVLISPPPSETLGAPLPDMTAHNADLALYRDAIRELAAARKLRFLDLFEALGGGKAKDARLTDNGIHYTPEGYAVIAKHVLAGLNLSSVEPRPQHASRLRETITEKNRLYFHEWRPANETYLHLFRKHEQGNNAAELPLFEPLVKAKELEIEVLRKVAQPKQIAQ
jgi:lysophospholipase L1-like esterase